jgi:DNA-directed RNA polymerase subunit RPC12/RpoP
MSKKPSLICPNCGKLMTLDVTSTTIKCRHCGYLPSLHDMPKQAAQEQPKAHKLPPTAITYRGKLESRVEGMFLSGHAALKQGKKDEALRYFRSAIDYQPDFIDAHLWISRLVDDEKLKRDHLTTVLAHEPAHSEALRDLMVLNGRLTQAEADRTHHSNEPESHLVQGAVEFKTQVLLCPICSGQMTQNDRTGNHECRFCGHKVETKKAERVDALAMGLLERKAKPKMWVIGDRLLHCNQCGAERTIPARKLAQTCPFCGSTHVIVQDAVNSFQQPDGLVPFKITRDEAGFAINAKLKSTSERFKGLFDNNKISNAQLDGLYIPYWIFDGGVEVTRTTIDRRTHHRDITPYQRETFSDAVYNVRVCAVSSPPPILTEKLGEFDWESMVAYDPRLLAKYPAEIYSVDFDRASLQCHSPISAMMKERYDLPAGDRIETTVSTSVKHMLYQLVLVPVWVGTLFERDGDVRPALVNGCTGEVILGKAQKPNK